jgi:hypothetical protein
MAVVKARRSPCDERLVGWSGITGCAGAWIQIFG